MARLPAFCGIPGVSGQLLLSRAFFLCCFLRATCWKGKSEMSQKDQDCLAKEFKQSVVASMQLDVLKMFEVEFAVHGVEVENDLPLVRVSQPCMQR